MKMSPSRVILVAAAAFSLLMFVTAYGQEDMTHVPNDDFDNPQRVPSLFNHEEHNETAGIEECNECHHIYENGVKSETESSEDQRCSDCHESRASDDMPALRKAFHINCKGCHLQQKKGPIMCGECHVK